MECKMIASGAGWDFFLIGETVWQSRTSERELKDVHGFPSSKRWVCSFEHWNRFRSIYSWAEEV